MQLTMSSKRDTDSHDEDENPVIAVGEDYLRDIEDNSLETAEGSGV